MFCMFCKVVCQPSTVLYLCTLCNARKSEIVGYNSFNLAGLFSCCNFVVFQSITGILDDRNFDIHVS